MQWLWEALGPDLHLLHPVEAHLNVQRHLYAVQEPQIAAHPHLLHLEVALGLHPHRPPTKVRNLWVEVHHHPLLPHLLHLRLLQPPASPAALPAQLQLLHLEAEEEEP